MQDVEPLRRAVGTGVRPERRWVIAAVALAAMSTTVAGVSVIVLLASRTPAVEPPPQAEIRIVELGGWHRPPLGACEQAYFQYTVYRYRDPTIAYEIADPFGIPLRLSCISSASGEWAVTRSAGPDRVYGTTDDSCWTGPADWSCHDLDAMSQRAMDRWIHHQVKPLPGDKSPAKPRRPRQPHHRATPPAKMP